MPNPTRPKRISRASAQSLIDQLRSSPNAVAFLESLAAMDSFVDRKQSRRIAAIGRGLRELAGSHTTLLSWQSAAKAAGEDLATWAAASLSARVTTDMYKRAARKAARLARS